MHARAWGLAALLLTGAGCMSGGRAVSYEQSRSGQYFRLVGVVSGDTLVVEMPEWNYSGTREVNVHLIGLSAPVIDEQREEFGAKRAAGAVASALVGGWVRLEFNNHENRPLVYYDGSIAADQECYVFVPPPDTDPGGHERFLNEWLLDEGLATRDDGIAQSDRGELGEYKHRMDLAARRARQTRRGVWSIPQ